MKKRVILSVTNDLVSDRRIQKVAGTLIKEGFDVIFIGRLLPDSPELPENFPISKRFKLWFHKGPLFYLSYQIRLFWYLLFSKYDILHANDLDTLLPNYLAAKVRRKPLVYDSHELYTEVPELSESPIKKKIWLAVESYIFPRLKHVITVNLSIAEIYHKKYGNNIHVIRNVPENKERKITNRDKMRLELGLPTDKVIFILQGAGLNIDRGGEELIEAMKHTINSYLLIVGKGDVLEQLKTLVKEYHLESKVRFINRLPYDEMMKYTTAADMGLTLDKDTNLNYRFSLPNKIFDYFAAGIPVMSSNLPEMQRIYRDYNYGIILESVEPHLIAEAMNSVDILSDEYLTWKKNVEKAAGELHWGNEAKILELIYKKF